MSAKRRHSTAELRVGNIEPAMECYRQLGFTSQVHAHFEEFCALLGVTISRPLCPRKYGMTEFDVIDLVGHRLVFAQPAPAK